MKIMEPEEKTKKELKPLEIDIDDLKENICKEFEIGGKKGLVCLEKRKLKFYEIVPTAQD